jgi:hypothetical protein
MVIAFVGGQQIMIGVDESTDASIDKVNQAPAPAFRSSYDATAAS